MLRYDLSRFKSGTDRIDQTYEPGAFESAKTDGEDFRVAEPVHLVLDVSKQDARVSMKGRVTATLDVPCSRCLEPFRVPVDAAIDALGQGDDEDEAAVLENREESA